MNLI
jgi:hypothetical protein